jgi:hypothetical protein
MLSYAFILAYKIPMGHISMSIIQIHILAPEEHMDQEFLPEHIFLPPESKKVII